MKVRLISRPQFLGADVPEVVQAAREDQLLGQPGEVVVELAGRTCYDSLGQGRDSKAYAQHILAVDHGSVLEHAYYVFLIEGVSRNLTHELVRHRVGVSISQRSTRYVDESEGEIVYHPLWLAACEEADDRPREDVWANEVKELGLSIELHEHKARSLYDRKVKLLQEWLQSKGTDKLAARKQARGAARAVLPTALATEMVWGANIRALRHVVTMRASEFADAEIRELSVALWRIMKLEAPMYFEDFEEVPSPDGLGACVRRRSS